MGNIIASAILILVFGLIVYYLLHSIKSKGTTCTSCTSCSYAHKCRKDTIKRDMLQTYKKIVD